jgi:hypothetical protein
MSNTKRVNVKLCKFIYLFYKNCEFCFEGQDFIMLLMKGQPNDTLHQNIHPQVINMGLQEDMILKYI